ncbi:hypothetical protein BLNAU_23753 [Blattamonas nauphoetae]|uniref:Uncharacterized protein n=1 Tax=Blattamonas nauphoetae TaxID=2049346 RepID=A0ABQ9WPB9_9EUKA|nr:hypothetical protein BLNAU_23753 [Blattamonas nauphoetae]
MSQLRIHCQRAVKMTPKQLGKKMRDVQLVNSPKQEMRNQLISMWTECHRQVQGGFELWCGRDKGVYRGGFVDRILYTWREMKDSVNHSNVNRTN